MKAFEIIQVIEKTAPLGGQAPWDASGVQVAALMDNVTHVGVALDPSLATVQAARAAGVDFLLTHHPLSMKPRFPNQADDYLCILSLLFGGVTWLYSAHTSLDVNPEGPVCWLAAALGLTQLAVLEPTAPATAERPTQGFGFVGDLPAPLEYAAFATQLGAVLGRQQWQASGPQPKTVCRVACCPGSGSSLAQEAVQLGADVLITGDIKYHAALDAPLRMLDVGHFGLEEEMMRRFAQQLGVELAVPVTFFPARDPLQQESAAQ